MTPHEGSVPDDLFWLVALPPYFKEGLGVRPAEQSGHEPTFSFRSEAERRWHEELRPYQTQLDSYVFSGDVAGFRQFAAQHREYYGQHYWKIQEMPDGLCRRLLHEIADERVRCEAERMMPLQQSGKRHEA